MTDGFGNCVVVSQPPSAGVGSRAPASETGQAAVMEAANDANTRKRSCKFCYLGHAV
jgi:hypothetical protein